MCQRPRRGCDERSTGVWRGGHLEMYCLPILHVPREHQHREQHQQQESLPPSPSSSPCKAKEAHSSSPLQRGGRINSARAHPAVKSTTQSNPKHQTPKTLGCRWMSPEGLQRRGDELSLSLFSCSSPPNTIRRQEYDGADADAELGWNGMLSLSIKTRSGPRETALAAVKKRQAQAQARKARKALSTQQATVSAGRSSGNMKFVSNLINYLCTRY